MCLILRFSLSFLCLVSLSDCAFRYADENGSYHYCWTMPFRRRYEPHEVRVQAMDALKKELNATFCDISYIKTIDPWLKHNQTRYKIFVITEKFVNMSGYKRDEIIKNIVYPILINPGDHRVEIVARTLEEKPEGLFTEDEMHYVVTYDNIPIFEGNRIKREIIGSNIHIIEGNRIKREIIEFADTTANNDMVWKFHPKKTCELVEERLRERFETYVIECKYLHDELRGNVAPGHEDQYKILVVAKDFLGQKPLRRTINVRKVLDDLVTEQMYKLHMVLKTKDEYERDKAENVEQTTNFKNYE